MGVAASIVGDTAVWRCRRWSQVRSGGADLNARVREGIVRQSRGTGRVHAVARTLGADTLGDPVFRHFERRAGLARACRPCGPSPRNT